MGSAQTRQYNNGSLYEKIRETLKDLVYKYDFWTKDEVCNKLTLVYNDKLLQYKKEDLQDVSISIGIIKTEI